MFCIITETQLNYFRVVYNCLMKRKLQVQEYYTIVKFMVVINFSYSVYLLKFRSHTYLTRNLCIILYREKVKGSTYEDQ